MMEYKIIVHDEVEYKPIPGYENEYAVSKNGDVLSLERYVKALDSVRLVKPRIRKQRVNKGGYMTTVLSSKRVNRNITTHRLVMLTYVGVSNLQVNHKNGIKTDNSLENLEYCTQSENVKHSWELGLRENERKMIKERNKGNKYKHNFIKRNKINIQHSMK